MPDTSSTLTDLLVPVEPQPDRLNPASPRARQSAGTALLVAVDALAVALTLEAMLLVTGALADPPRLPGGGERTAWAAAITAVLASNVCLGVYEVAGRNAVERFRLRVWSTLMLPFLAVALLSLLDACNSRVSLALAGTAILWLPLGLIAEAVVVRWLVAHAALGLRALLIGDAASCARIAAMLDADPQAGIKLVGFCGTHDGRQSPLACLGSLAHAGQMGGTADIAIVALSPELATLDLSNLPFRRILVLPEATGLPSLWLRSRALGNSAALEFRDPLQARINLHTKRALDLLIAVPLLVLMAPVVAILAALICVVSPGPVFYVQQRTGWRGKPLRILKLRSMHLDAERRLSSLLRDDPVARAEWQRCVKLSRDPRILPVVGTLIRRTSLDELPQLWNVIRGDMSMVGPRPFPSYHLDLFDPAFRAVRSSVRPGLTGLWQVSQRSDADLRQQKTLDSFYIRNWSLWFDFYIILRTVPAVIAQSGAR